MGLENSENFVEVKMNSSATNGFLVKAFGTMVLLLALSHLGPRELGVDEPLWDGTIWNNPLPDDAYPGPVPIHGTYYSQSMNVNVGYNVLLPPEYDGSTRFPVIICSAEEVLTKTPIW
jgi:hypothetical protein